MRANERLIMIDETAPPLPGALLPPRSLSSSGTGFGSGAGGIGRGGEQDKFALSRGENFNVSTMRNPQDDGSAKHWQRAAETASTRGKLRAFRRERVKPETMTTIRWLAVFALICCLLRATSANLLQEWQLHRHLRLRASPSEVSNLSLRLKLTGKP